jgi:Flp pilus assembly protein TadG
MTRNRAQSLVEFAFIAPILFALVFGLLDIGRAVWYSNTTAFIARDIARQREFVTQSSVDLTRCKQMFLISSCTASDVTVTDKCPEIDVTYLFKPVLFSSATLPLTATSYVPLTAGACP